MNCKKRYNPISLSWLHVGYKIYRKRAFRTSGYERTVPQAHYPSSLLSCSCWESCDTLSVVFGKYHLHIGYPDQSDEEALIEVFVASRPLLRPLLQVLFSFVYPLPSQLSGGNTGPLRRQESPLLLPSRREQVLQPLRDGSRFTGQAEADHRRAI